MKNPGAETAFLTPDSDGWRVQQPGHETRTLKTLDEAAASVPADRSIHLALPGSFVLLERLTLPSIDPAELAGMVQLQLEKTLPYPVEEASSDFEVISQTEGESTLLSVAANTARIDELCEPLKNRARLPQKVTFYAMHVAASCPPDEVVLCIWPEDGQLQIAIAENAKLGFAQNLSGFDAETLGSELPQILLGAEMEGVSTRFSRIRIEQGCIAIRETISQLFEQPVELISFDTAMPEPAGNLAPPAWQAEVRRIQKAGRLRQYLQLAAVVYLLAIAAAFIYLAWLKSRVQKIDTQLVTAQPQLALIKARKQRWEALEPAISPARYTMEILYRVYSNLPSEEVKITRFEHTLKDFKVEGEAPNYKLVTDFYLKLRDDKALGDYQLEQPQPVALLPNGGTPFRMSGKLLKP
ncbi:MAG: Type secretory pathway, component PulL [Chthoniobacteraceae bacterium]|nr:Type secretory pathway, component PulL [Chthoniobacteraceae bacterium]